MGKRYPEDTDPRLRAKYKQVVPISKALAGYMNKLMSLQDKQLYFGAKAVQAWRDMLGVHFAQYSSMEKLEKGVFMVRISSAPLRNELFMQRSELAKKLNNTLGEHVIKMIKFY